MCSPGDRLLPAPPAWDLSCVLVIVEDVITRLHQHKWVCLLRNHRQNVDGNFQDHSEKDLCIHFIPFVCKSIVMKQFIWTCSHFAWQGNEPGSHDFSLAEHSGGSSPRFPRFDIRGCSSLKGWRRESAERKERHGRRILDCSGTWISTAVCTLYFHGSRQTCGLEALSWNWGDLCWVSSKFT